MVTNGLNYLKDLCDYTLLYLRLGLYLKVCPSFVKMSVQTDCH